LLRARALAGDTDLGARFIAAIAPIRWPDDGLAPADVREVRRIKARVEKERLPRGADPTLNTKLGRGGLADVEWTVQLLQLRFAGQVPGLRTPSTLRALAAARVAGLIELADADTLESAWRLATRVRNAVVLARGKPVDAALTEVVRLAEEAGGGRLTMLVTDGQVITATVWGTSLCWRRLPAGVVVASEPYDDDPSWVDIPDRSLLVADATGATVEPLG